jgi:hypothetical protein
LPTQARIQPFRVSAGNRIQHEQRAAAVERHRLGRAHQRGAEPLPPDPAMHQHLRQVGPVRLVLRQIEHELHRAAHAPLVLGHQQRAPAVREAVGHAPPERQRLVPRHRLHEAHRRAGFDAVHEHIGKALEARLVHGV